MSESSKMGLFGSKDDKKESTSDDATKPDSSDRYSPYCIDSDSETYDTEALSIMDINDIIGVQTGQAVESTLESEIAALTEIITDTKDETNSNMMNEIHGESPDTKFSEELLTEFSSFSPSENPIPSTSKVGFQERLITHVSETEDDDKSTSNKSILEDITSIEDETQDRLIKGIIEVETDVQLLDKVANKASEDVVFGEVERNNELDVIKADNNIQDKILFSAVRSSGDIQKDEVSASDGAELPITTDATSESETSTNAIAESTITITTTDLLEQTLEAVKMSVVDERKDDNKDSSKCEDVSVVSVDGAAEDSPNTVKEDDQIADTTSEEKEVVDDPEDEKSTDVLTNLGSTSKSLQLIGEAYISEDSQETDERDESTDVKVVSVPLAKIMEAKTEEKNEKKQQKTSSDPAPTDISRNEADSTESIVGKCNLDNQDSMSLEDNNKPDKTKELSLNLEDNRDNDSQDINVDLKKNVHSEDDLMIKKPDSVDTSLQNEEIKDKSDESAKVRLPLPVCSDRETSATSESTSITEILETKEECLQEIELPEDILSKSDFQTSEMITADDVSTIQTSQSLEEVQETTSERPKPSDKEMEISESVVETLNLNRETVSETNTFSEQNQEPSQQTEVLPSAVLSCSETESNEIPEIQIENLKSIESVGSLTAFDEQDHVTSITSMNEKELVNSQSIKDSESSILLGKVDTNIANEVDECVGATNSVIEIIPIQEKSKGISDNVEQLLETVEENTEECIMDNRNIEKEITGDGETEQKDEVISADKMVEGIEKEVEKMESESIELQMDNESQSPSMKITSPIVEGTVIDSGENKDIHLGVEKIREELVEAENLGTELDQLVNTSDNDNDVPIEDVIEANKQDTTELSETFNLEKLSSDIVKTDLASSKIPEENLDTEKDYLTIIETNVLSEAKSSENKIEMEEQIESQSDAVDSEVLSSNTKDVSEMMIETTLENTTGNLKLSSLGSVEPDSNKDDANKLEIIEELREVQEICEAERVDSDQRKESQISEADEKEMLETQVYDKNQQLEENESIGELSDSVGEKPMENTSDEDQKELEESENVIESSTEMVSDIKQTIAEFETASDSELESQQAKIEEKPKIEAIQHKADGSEVSEHPKEIDNEFISTKKIDETQCREPSPLDAKCGSANLTLDPQSDGEQKTCEIQPEKLENKTNLQVGTDDTLQSVLCDELMENVRKTVNENLPENQAEENLDSQIESEELREVESISSALSNVSKLLENEEELGKEKLPLVKPVCDDNFDSVANIHSSPDTVESKQTLSEKNEVETTSEATEINLADDIVPITLQSDDLIEMDVKIDEDLQCEPIEELAKLAVVADEILIDELANSVLKDTVQPLENIDTLGILPDSHLSISTIISSDELKSTTITNEASEIEDQPVSLLEVDETCFIEDLNQTPSVSHGADYITDVIISSTNIENIELVDNIDIDENVTADEFEDKNQGKAVKTSENLFPKDIISIDPSIASISEKCELEIGGNLLLDKNIELELPLKLEEEKLIETAVLQACDAKIDLSDEVLFENENSDQNDVLCNALTDNVDTSQQSSEFSELECAVKFLQESEEQTIDSPLLLSPKITEEIVEDNSDQSKSCLFLSETEVCQETLELPVELEEITPDSIAISEAEIISEAAKLENERKLKISEEIIKTSASVEKLDESRKSSSDNNSEMLKSLLTTPSVSGWQEKLEENIPSTCKKSENIEIPNLSDNIIIRSEKMPKISILEERLKEPPKIEIPVSEMSPKISDTPSTPKTSLLMQRDSRIDTKSMYQKMLESPKGSDKIEPKIADTPRKDSDKYDFENVGSPRIILKIAKSAIADCSEPRSPKSPKIRSATNSPNPEDSPGQKLGKIKLKLSKGGHPSIISNENFDESAQRHTEAILSPSHIGMKIKLSKSGDASIIQPEKHDLIDDNKETKHKFEESSPKRIESPLGMKIKLSKTGDPSIVQQESKESTSKRKDKLDIGQEMPKRMDSPIGMKIKLSKSGDASIIQPEKQEILDDVAYMEIPKRTESPIGMKIKLSRTGDASIISSECSEEFRDSPPRSRDKPSTNQDTPRRTDSPLGMKFKLSKSGGASIIQPEKSEGFEDFKDKPEISADVTKRVESPIGMKIKLSKTGDASIIHPEKHESDEHKDSNIIKHREKSETQDIQKRTDSPLGMRIKVTKTGEASVVVPSEEFKECLMLNSDSFEITREVSKRTESPIGMKIKLSKSGDASIIHPEKQDFLDETKDSSTSNKGSSSISQEGFKSLESSLGMKIKLSKTGDASIIHPDIPPDCKDSQLKRTEKLHSPGESTKRTDSPLGMKIKLSKTGDASIIEPDKKEKTTIKQTEKLTIIPQVSQKRKEMEYPLEMKIKLSKTGHPTIIANEKQESFAEMHSKIKDYSESGQSTHHRHIGSMSPGKDSQLRIFKTGNSTIIQSSRSEVTIEPVQMNQERSENSLDISPACNKEVIISPVEHKKSKLEAKLSHILPEVTIQPVTCGEQQQIMLDKKSSTISRQQMSVINQEISITQVSHSKPADLSMSGKLKEILRKNATNSPASSDCEIIEHRPELIIVNENSNSSQDIMIIEEVKPPPQEVKVPRKRGRPKRSSLPPGQNLMRPIVSQHPLALDNIQQSAGGEHRESDRPKRTCRSQKSYAPPKRGRGRGRGKRKMDRVDCAIGKVPRLEDPLTVIERSTMSLIAPLQPRLLPEATAQTSELYKALKQSPEERKRLISENLAKQGFPEMHKKMRLEPESGIQSTSNLPSVSTEEHLIPKPNVDTSDSKAVMISEILQLTEPVVAQQSAQNFLEAPKPDVQEPKNIITDMTTTEHQNWLTPSIKLPETTGKTEPISMVQVMDEETRMSAESNSRSQTPARNISIPVVETVINEESQGSVLSTATTESEKVKVRNRRMEINFDPDEGPFTVDKIAEYEWPLDKKGDTFMIQEQISQYLGVKSFKRKYPDLKRRMVEMEERNFLRENCLVSESMCDMGLTAICSSEVLDIMCSDFPDQYEEYRKHMREKQAKEHSKKQKELTAAANAERNRIDLAEMAVQSALSWNVNFNRARKESRKYSLDLQSFTIHQPKKQLKVDPERKASNYPVALIPGQFTDYYREYTPAELRYYPLNTVLYGPMRPNERKFDSQSEGSQSDSDSDSSSDDSSSSSSEGTQDTEESQSTVDEVEMEISSHKEDNKNLKCKMCLKHLNKHGKAEVLIQCGTCNGNVHPSCIDLTLDMVPHIQGYSWQCTDCKTCVQCHNPADEDKMLFCDMCDRGYHIYCVGLRRVPQGRWHCRECAVCASCGLRQPGGANSDRNSVAQWQHEYKKGERNTRVYVSTLCVPCSKLWRKGRYCPHCSRCHSAQRLDLEPNLVHCGACDKYLHLGCVEIRSGTLDRKNYICDWCSTPGQQISRTLISKNFRT